MRVKVTMVIETEDYGGREFKDEIEKLIKDIDSRTKLVKFAMQQEDGTVDAWRDYRWEGPPVLVTFPSLPTLTLGADPFTDWLLVVDTYLESSQGCSIHDLPDYLLRDWYDDELHPIEAAQRAVAEYKGEDYE